MLSLDCVSSTGSGPSGSSSSSRMPLLEIHNLDNSAATSSHSYISEGLGVTIELNVAPENIENSTEADHMFVDNVNIENIPSFFDVKVNNMFTTKENLLTIMRKIAIINNFEFVVDKSSQSRVYLSCSVSTCSWKFRARSLNGNKNIWKITHYVNKHSCLLDISHNNHRQASCSFVSACLKKFFVDESVAEKFTPKDIILLMRKDYGVDISYYKAWKGRELALNAMRGNAEDSYKNLPIISAALKEKNEGSYSDFMADNDGKFRYFFFSFGASIAGWHFCRPVISVDGTFLKCKYKGTMLLAASLDGDNHIFPLGFGIVDSENDAAWLWFFENLKKALGDRDELVIISYRNSSISKAIGEIFPNAHHGICTQHLVMNLSSKFKNAAIEPIFRNCAKAYSLEEYKFYMDALRGINPAIEDYLILANPSKWARSHFERKRYNVMTTNISECMNSILNDARSRPICSVVEAFRKLLQRWFFDRRTSGQACRSLLTVWAEVLLHTQEEIARTMNVDPINDAEFEVYDKGVQEIVNIINKSCSCRIWQLEDFPCCHAIAALWKKKLSPRSFVSPYYTKEAFVGTYSGSIYPSGLDLFSNNPYTDQACSDVLPPDEKRPRGRPKKKRFPSVGENASKRLQCSSCGRVGHNKRSCSKEGPINAQQAPKKKCVQLY